MYSVYLWKMDAPYMILLFRPSMWNYYLAEYEYTIWPTIHVEWNMNMNIFGAALLTCICTCCCSACSLQRGISRSTTSGSTEMLMSCPSNSTQVPFSLTPTEVSRQLILIFIIVIYCMNDPSHRQLFEIDDCLEDNREDY